jgi:arylsulfatase A-like enzyme
VLLPIMLATLSCHGSGAPVWQRMPLKGLTTVTSLSPDPSADAVSAAVQVRQVLTQPQTLLAERVVVTAPGEREFPVTDRTEPWFAIQAADVQLRNAHGISISKPARLQRKHGARTAVVDFTPAEVGASYDVTVTASLPWPPLRAETEDFAVPSGAHLRFGVALQQTDAPFVPMRGHFRVTLKPQTGAARAVYESDLENAPHTQDSGWRDVDIDLSPYAGQTARVLFETRRDVSLGDVPFKLPLPLISEPLLVSAAPRRQRRNVVLISIDTLRADHVGVYGYPRPTSPLLDRLAANGTLFLNTFAVWPETSVSHMTMFTSLYPAVHGVSLMAWGSRPLPPWQSTLAEVLSRDGYITGALTEDGLLAHPLGFARGFQDYLELFKPKTFGAAAAVAEHVFDGGARWLRRHPGDLFFLFLHTYQVHERVAAGDAYDALREQFRHDAMPALNQQAATMIRDYDAAIRYTDDALASVVRTLDELHLTDQTLLIVTSDHGEEFGTHQAWGHGGNLSDFALHVPLILRSPGLVPAGKRVPAQVGLIDLLPTVLDLLGLPPLAQAQGRSFATLARGETAAVSQPLFSELGDNVRALRDPSYKVIWKAGEDGGRAEYYDLRHDPGEVEPRSDATERTQQALALIHEHDTQSVRDREQLAAGTAAAPAAAPVALDPQTAERMRALGYDVHRP